MSSSESSFRWLYLKRLLRALDRLKRRSGDIKSSSCNIKLAADVTLALAASPRAAWRHGLMNKISCDEKNRRILKRILGRKRFRTIMAERARSQLWKRLYLMRRRLLLCRSSAKRFEPVPVPVPVLVPASVVARNPVDRRMKHLQRLIPGAKSMDTCCLLTETVDYIVALKTQVQVLQSLVNNSDVNNS